MTDTRSIAIFYDRSVRMWTIRVVDGDDEATIYEPTRDLALLAAGRESLRIDLPYGRISIG